TRPVAKRLHSGSTDDGCIEHNKDQNDQDDNQDFDKENSTEHESASSQDDDVLPRPICSLCHAYGHETDHCPQWEDVSFFEPILVLSLKLLSSVFSNLPIIFDAQVFCYQCFEYGQHPCAPCCAPISS